MRKVVYIIIVSLLFFVPLERVPVSQLLPVTAVALDVEDGDVVLQTDGGLQGRGHTVVAAVDDMNKRAPVVVYLDTAKYLLVGENAVDLIGQMQILLKGNVRVCVTDKRDDYELLIQYLDVHGDLPKLKEWRAAG